MTRSSIRHLPYRTWAHIEAMYPRRRARRYPDAPPPSDAELSYLKKALDRTFYIDGDRMDHLLQVCFDVMETWVAAGDDPKKQAELRKDDFRIY